MIKLMIRVDTVLSDELLSAFPQLTTHTQPVHSTLTGEIADREELQGVLNHLTSLGIQIVEVITMPND
jgi:hypothetical protein